MPENSSVTRRQTRVAADDVNFEAAEVDAGDVVQLAEEICFPDSLEAFQADGLDLDRRFDKVDPVQDACECVDILEEEEKATRGRKQRRWVVLEVWRNKRSEGDPEVDIHEARKVCDKVDELRRVVERDVQQLHILHVRKSLVPPRQPRAGDLELAFDCDRVE